MFKCPCMNAMNYCNVKRLFGERTRLGCSFQRLAGNIGMQLGFDEGVEPHSRGGCAPRIFTKLTDLNRLQSKIVTLPGNKSRTLLRELTFN